MLIVATSNAQTAKAEFEAFSDIHESSPTYFVHLYDSNIHQISLTGPESFDDIAIVLISWPNGDQVMKFVTDPSNVKMLLLPD